jgi:maltooligosyltrehalose trehalohydrolase
MRRVANGLFEATVSEASAGDRYGYTIDEGAPLPDPASRYQPAGVHGPSEIIDAGVFTWHDERWHGHAPRDLVIYELHVGTFTAEGTFASARQRLSDVRDLGITAIELMPVADFPGARNWGYDGVALFAPSRAYGHPDDLRALVDEAHCLGLSVILDVVYNHLGPEGAYVTMFNPHYLTTRHECPWGCAVNLDGPGAGTVRDFITDNALHWIHEYHVDGLRLDATHALIDTGERAGRRHFVAELATVLRHEAGRPVLLHAEDHRNRADLVDGGDRGWTLDGVWADDFHHVMRRLLAGDADGYYEDYQGTTSELARTIEQGWLYTGQYSPHLKGVRGTDPSEVEMRRFIVCLENHDQVGNRALGDRLNTTIDPARWRAASALLLTAPMTPLLFMGQEWGASTPFCYFTDHEPDLGARVTEGRRREFKDFAQFSSPEARERIPDPQAPETFAASRLRWEERTREPHRAVLALYRALLQLRREHPALGASDERRGYACACDEDSVIVRREDENAVFWVFVRLRGAGIVRICVDQLQIPLTHARVLLTSEDPPFVSAPKPPVWEASAAQVRFQRPGAVIVMAAPR